MASEQVYDFVVVGGGTAGLVLANRLTEDPNTKVLVLEAGSNSIEDPRIKTPGLSGALYDNDDFDWKFQSVPQKSLYDKVIAYPRGKTVGGSSAINILALVYPNKSSIDNWGALGNDGWDWERLSKYYQKFHTFSPPSKSSKEALGVDYIDDSIQGHSGPIKSSFPNFVGPLVKAWPQTLKNLGWNVTGDPMGGKYIGGFSGPYAVDPEKVVRSHAGSAYYAPASDRLNLFLETQAMTEKILFKEVSGVPTAEGVMFSSKGEQKIAKASKEVILAAGVFQSPQLLELSGIGRREILEQHGITVVIENPNVGENLQDHAMTGICAEVAEGVPTGDLRRDPEFLNQAKEMYTKQGTGPLTAGFPSFGFMPLPGWAEDDGIKETLDKYISSSSTDDVRPSRLDQAKCIRKIVESPQEASIQLCLAASQVHFDKSSYGEVFAVTEPENYLAILVSLPHPFSAGVSHISSSNPKDPPTIDPRFMSHPLDPEVMGRHLVVLDRILTAEPLASLVKPGGRRLPAGSPLFDTSSSSEQRLEAGREHARRYIRSTSHPVGTCAMLPPEKGGVVDPRLRVYGVHGLRVVDASIFPMVPSGNIQSTVYAVAERAADFVREDWS